MDDRLRSREHPTRKHEKPGLGRVFCRQSICTHTGV